MRELRAYIDASAVSRPFDIIVEGETSGTDAHAATAIVGEWRDAGATWWIEAQWEAPLDAVRARVQAGPPRVAVG